MNDWLHDVPADHIEIGGFVVRRWTGEDLDRADGAIEASKDHLAPWMPWAAGHDRDSTREFLTRAEQAWTDRSEFVYGVLDDQETIVGACGLHARIGRGGLEIGYWVGAPYLRRGIATLAAAALTAEGARLPGVTYLEIRHDRANERSAGVPRKLGYVLVGERPDEVEAPAEEGGELIWRMLPAEYPGSAAHELVTRLRAPTARSRPGP